MENKHFALITINGKKKTQIQKHWTTKKTTESSFSELGVRNRPGKEVNPWGGGGSFCGLIMLRFRRRYLNLQTKSTLSYKQVSTFRDYRMCLVSYTVRILCLYHIITPKDISGQTQTYY
jgi:hypothetical protein